MFCLLKWFDTTPLFPPRYTFMGQAMLITEQSVTTFDKKYDFSIEVQLMMRLAE